MEKNLSTFVSISLILALIYFLRTPTMPDVAPLEFTASATVTAGNLVIAGSLNVPDGANLLYRITLAKAEEGDGVVLEDWTTVTGGRFQEVVNLAPFPSGELLIKLIFQIVGEDRSQSSEIIRHYGVLGGNMTGVTVVESEWGRLAKITVISEKP